MIVLEIVGLLTAALVLALVWADQEAEGDPATESNPCSDRGDRPRTSSPSVRLYDQEAERVNAALRERLEEVVRG